MGNQHREDGFTPGPATQQSRPEIHAALQHLSSKQFGLGAVLSQLMLQGLRSKDEAGLRHSSEDPESETLKRRTLPEHLLSKTGRWCPSSTLRTLPKRHSQSLGTRGLAGGAESLHLLLGDSVEVRYERLVFR